VGHDPRKLTSMLNRRDVISEFGHGRKRSVATRVRGPDWVSHFVGACWIGVALGRVAR
jgi:hypothetical protein